MKVSLVHLNEALSVIEELKFSSDRNVVWTAKKIEEQFVVIQQFVSANQDHEAAYTARFLLMDVCTLAASLHDPGVQEAATVLSAFVDDLCASTGATGAKNGLVVQQSSSKGPELFAVGTLVRVVQLRELALFKASWKLHHALQEAQLAFAGHEFRVVSVSYYHGGDVLYNLAGTGDYLWHERLLEAVNG